MEDEGILQLYFARDEKAIEATEKKYGSYCTAIARNILGTREDAEECVNDTYLKAWNAIPPHKPEVLSGFLGKITRNLAFNRYKRNTADKRGGGELPFVLEELAGCVSDKETVEQVIEYKALVRDLNGFLGTLPEKKRNIFICRYFYTDGIDRIALRYGMTYGGVSMTLKRLRTKLHSYLTKRGYEL